MVIVYFSFLDLYSLAYISLHLVHACNTQFLIYTKAQVFLHAQMKIKYIRAKKVQEIRGKSVPCFLGLSHYVSDRGHRDIASL